MSNVCPECGGLKGIRGTVNSCTCIDDCFNAACDDYDPCFKGNCRWRNKASTKLCWGFVSKQKREEGIKMQDENKKGGLPPNATGGSRMGARSVLLDKIGRCKRQLMAFRTLEEAIQWENLSVKDEELLWHYFSSH